MVDMEVSKLQSIPSLVAFFPEGVEMVDAEVSGFIDDFGGVGFLSDDEGME